MKKAWIIGIKNLKNRFIPAILSVILRSENSFLLTFIIFYGLGFMAINLWASLILFTISGLILLAPLTIKPDSPKYENSSFGRYILILLFMPFAAYNIFSRYSYQVETSAFKSYLIKHDCKNIGETTSVHAGCDDIDCLDYEVIEYTCRGNKKINSYIFKIGREAGFYK